LIHTPGAPTTGGFGLQHLTNTRLYKLVGDRPKVELSGIHRSNQ
jgi:hypothetical protein